MLFLFSYLILRIIYKLIEIILLSYMIYINIYILFSMYNFNNYYKYFHINTIIL